MRVRDGRRGLLVAGVAAIALGLATVPTASAEIFGGVDFPAGATSFADGVTAFEPMVVGSSPGTSHLVGANALGPPDCGGGQPDTCYVSLGDGGRITFRFLDNVLTGSGTAAQDLYIFEIGPAVEDMLVEVSADGVTYTPVGTVSGQPSGIDVDAFGFGPSAVLRYVRVTDDPNADGQGGDTAGADLDAVGAISSQAPPTSSSTSSSTTSTTAGPGSTTSTTTGGSTTSTTVASTTSSTAPASTSSSSTSVAARASSTTRASSVLARTGSDPWDTWLLSLLLIGLGLVATGRSLTRSARS
jgi:hypothetical protein